MTSSTAFIEPSPSRRATQRAIEIEPKTPTAAMIRSTGSVLAWWLIAISAPRAHVTSVSSTSAATARSRIDGPTTMRHSVTSAAAAKTTAMTATRTVMRHPPPWPTRSARSARASRRRARCAPPSGGRSRAVARRPVVANPDDVQVEDSAIAVCVDDERAGNEGCRDRRVRHDEVVVDPHVHRDDGGSGLPAEVEHLPRDGERAADERDRGTRR